MTFLPGNSIIPTDEQHDEHYAIRCQECDAILTSSELRKGEPFLCEEHEHLFDNEEESE